MGQALFFGLCSFFGAITQELAHWYELRTNLARGKYEKLLRSGFYWAVTGGMILVSTVGPVLWKSVDLSHYDAADFMVFGAAFPVLFKKAVTGANAITRRRHLGGVQRSDTVSLERPTGLFSMYFQTEPAAK